MSDRLNRSYIIIPVLRIISVSGVYRGSLLPRDPRERRREREERVYVIGAFSYLLLLRIALAFGSCILNGLYIEISESISIRFYLLWKFWSGIFFSLVTINFAICTRLFRKLFNGHSFKYFHKHHSGWGSKFWTTKCRTTNSSKFTMLKVTRGPVIRFFNYENIFSFLFKLFEH